MSRGGTRPAQARSARQERRRQVARQRLSKTEANLTLQRLKAQLLYLNRENRNNYLKALRAETALIGVLVEGGGSVFVPDEVYDDLAVGVKRYEATETEVDGVEGILVSVIWPDEGEEE